MAVTLEELQAEVNADGVTDHYTNGANQEGQKASAALQAYNSTLKNYNTVIKQLYSLVPHERPKSKLAALEDSEPKETEEERAARINAEIAAAAAKQKAEREREARAKEQARPIHS